MVKGYNPLIYHHAGFHDILCHKTKLLRKLCHICIYLLNRINISYNADFVTFKYVVHHFSKISENSLIYEEKTWTNMKKRGSKDWLQITHFCYFIYDENNKLWEYRNYTHIWKYLYPVYNNNKRLYDPG